MNSRIFQCLKRKFTNTKSLHAHNCSPPEKNFPTPALYCCECGLFSPALARPQASGAGSPPQALP
jgi:hypothetical protein